MSSRKKTNKLKEKETDWQERIVQVRRVTKVVKGGKKLSFRAILIIGNEKGQVGVGVGKASDVIGAVKKAVTDSKKHLVNVPVTKNNSIPHIITGQSGAARVIIRPSAPGSGVITAPPAITPDHQLLGQALLLGVQFEQFLNLQV